MQTVGARKTRQMWPELQQVAGSTYDTSTSSSLSGVWPSTTLCAMPGCSPRCPAHRRGRRGDGCHWLALASEVASSELRPTTTNRVHLPACRVAGEGGSRAPGRMHKHAVRAVSPQRWVPDSIAAMPAGPPDSTEPGCAAPSQAIATPRSHQVSSIGLTKEQGADAKAQHRGDDESDAAWRS